jgi:hypothetical protein
MIKCKNNTFTNVTCKSQVDIDKYFSAGKTFNAIFLNNYFDFSDYVSPIKKYLDNTITYLTLPTA